MLKTYGLKVSNLYISQVKRKLGLDIGKNYNLPKSENPVVPNCPPDKEQAITNALKDFGMVHDGGEILKRRFVKKIWVS